MGDREKYNTRAKFVLSGLGALVFAAAVLVNWSILPSDEMAARMVLYALDNGRQVYRPDGTVRDVDRDSVAVISMIDCRTMKEKVFDCAMRISDPAGGEYLVAFEASWDRGSALSNVDNYRVFELAVEKQREILIKRKMLQP